MLLLPALCAQTVLAQTIAPASTVNTREYTFKVNSPVASKPLEVDGRIWILSHDGRLTALELPTP